MSLQSKEVRTRVSEVLKKWRPYQKPNHTKAVIQILNSFLPFIGIWVLMYLLWDISKWAVIGLGLLNAFFLVRIFIIQHDCGHRTFVRSGFWRNVIGYSCSIFSSIPYHYWAKSHHFHHQHNGMLEVRDIGDIHTLTVDEYKSKSRWQRFKYRIYRMPFVLFVLGPIYYLMIHNRLPLIKFPEFRKINWTLYLYNGVLIGIIALLCWLLDWQKIIAVHGITLGFFAIIAVWFFYVQHQHEHGYKHWKVNWDFLSAAIQGSSYYKLPRLVNWFTGNIDIHHVHHLNPAIPNYHLTACIQATPWINQFTTEITFWESLKLITHKLWDESSERMISFREFYKKEKAGLLKGKMQKREEELVA